MRIIHTSDWHLGQNFMGKIREKEHQKFLDWLLATIDNVKADVLVVAGDIFDTGTPPSYARAMFNQFIVSLRSTRCTRAVFVAGNHDSAATLNESRELLACLDVFVCGRVFENPRDHVLVLNNANGRPGALLCAVPFIRPRDLIKSTAGETGQDKKQALTDTISDFYHQVYEAALEKQKELELNKSLPILATGHLTMVGGMTSESVRDIYIGSLDAFPGNGFPAFDYVALGHLHRAQQVKGADHIQYSGSPIPLSFDEGKKEKQVLLLSFEEKGIMEIKAVQVPCFRKLCTIKGNLDQIEKQISLLSDHDPDKTMWLEVEVAADDYLFDLHARIQAMIEEMPIELLRIKRKRKPGETGIDVEAKEKLEELSVEEVFLRRLASEEHDDQDRELLLNMFREIVYNIDQSDCADQTDQSDKTGKVDQPDTTHQTDKTDKVDQPDTTNQTDKAELTEQGDES